MWLKCRTYLATLLSTEMPLVLTQLIIETEAAVILPLPMVKLSETVLLLHSFLKLKIRFVTFNYSLYHLAERTGCRSDRYSSTEKSACSKSYLFFIDAYSW